MRARQTAFGRARGLGLLLALALLSAAVPAHDAQSFAWQQRLGATLPLQLPFTDAAGRTAPLAAQFGREPVLLVLGYLRCANLCGTTAIGASEALAQADTPARMLFVSIDPADRANGFEAQSLPRGWRVLSGSAGSVRALAVALGFRYTWDESMQQYVHPAGFVVVTPSGTVSRYFPGVRFDAARLRGALLAAADERVGTLAERLLLLCRHLLPQGTHSAAILDALRAAALLALLGLAAHAWRAWRR